MKEEKNIINRATECLEMEASAIMALIPRLNEDFLRAVQLIRDCKGKIVVTGVGKSGHIGSKIAATLASTGTPAFLFSTCFSTALIPQRVPPATSPKSTAPPTRSMNFAKGDFVFFSCTGC